MVTVTVTFLTCIVFGLVQPRNAFKLKSLEKKGNVLSISLILHCLPWALHPQGDLSIWIFQGNNFGDSHGARCIYGGFYNGQASLFGLQSAPTRGVTFLLWNFTLILCCRLVHGRHGIFSVQCKETSMDSHITYLMTLERWPTLRRLTWVNKTMSGHVL